MTFGACASAKGGLSPCKHTTGELNDVGGISRKTARLTIVANHGVSRNGGPYNACIPPRQRFLLWRADNQCHLEWPRTHTDIIVEMARTKPLVWPETSGVHATLVV